MADLSEIEKFLREKGVSEHVIGEEADYLVFEKNGNVWLTPEGVRYFEGLEKRLERCIKVLELVDYESRISQECAMPDVNCEGAHFHLGKAAHEARALLRVLHKEAQEGRTSKEGAVA